MSMGRSTMHTGIFSTTTATERSTATTDMLRSSCTCQVHGILLTRLAAKQRRARMLSPTAPLWSLPMHPRAQSIFHATILPTHPLLRPALSFILSCHACSHAVTCAAPLTDTRACCPAAPLSGAHECHLLVHAEVEEGGETTLPLGTPIDAAAQAVVNASHCATRMGMAVKPRKGGLTWVVG